LCEKCNFNFEKFVRDGRKLGFLICQSRPRSFKDGKGIVFFASRGFIVGLYALPTIVPVDWETFAEFSEDASNISAPLEMCVRWKSINRVPINKVLYFAGRKTIRKYIYVGDPEAKAIVCDAIAAHRDAPSIEDKLHMVAKSVWGPDIKL
jgi:hypothetical protein